MSEPVELWQASMEPVRDRELCNKMRQFILKKRGMGETTLQKIVGAPIYVWYANAQTSVIWNPVSEPIFYEAKP